MFNSAEIIIAMFVGFGIGVFTFGAMDYFSKKEVEE